MAPMLLAAAAACAHALVPGSPSCGRAVLRRRGGGVRFQGPGVGSSFPAHDGGGDAPGARGALKGVILGGGSFGLAMACVLGRAGVPATLLVRSRADADAVNARGRHPKYLPDVDLPEGTRATADAAEALRARAAEARASRPSDARAGAGRHAAAQARVRHAWVFTSADVVGLEVGGAVKNVLALAAGMAEGLDLGTNAVTALVTRGLYEMQRIALAMGGRASTIGAARG
ncbi:NAD-dependent glycerol-3-phosphate dehydrogenase [Aureococcus anophagefferens]|nr:NAD-dependent glycerol-3-phosphate dehydrogenase [Aureococcus anophagefferens]